MYSLIISPKARKELKKISRLYKDAISTAFEEITEDPTMGKPLTRELTKRFSYRVGIYRIVYKVNKQDKIIYVLTAGHRATVYR